ncbi:MAG: hypothetical protein MUO85_02870 [candidate division Zixibacteria bacterium]|nr:hypothetical protein [candidate division Zixibacteria bacterium]
MTLLQEIQVEAVDSKSDLGTLLRKCRILASRLKNEELKNWVQYELDGYPPDAALPDYRKLQTQSYGYLSGPFGQSINNAPIPSMCIPKEIRHLVAPGVEFRNGVTALQDMISRRETEALQVHWPANVVALVSDRIMEGMTLLQAWKLIPASAVVSILDIVRNRILNFALEIESAAPNAGEGNLTPALTADKVSNVFNTYIMGNVGNIASGNSQVTQQAILTISQGDWSSLEKFLKSLDIDDTDIAELKEAVKQEPKATPKGFGGKVASWIGKMVTKSAQGIWNVATTVASNVLSKALAQYYGWPGA